MAGTAWDDTKSTRVGASTTVAGPDTAGVSSGETLLVGQTMEEAGLRTGTGANVLSTIRGAEQHVVDWSPDLRMEADDIWVVFGTEEHLKAVA